MATEQKTKTKQEQQATKQENMGGGESKGQVATIAPPRLPYHPAVKEKFGYDIGQWRVFVEATWPGAKTTDAVVMALNYCKARNLDPFKRAVHIVPIWDSKKRCEVETVWPGINELRTTAHRTKEYAGCDETSFGDMIDLAFQLNEENERKNITLRVPSWARITVYRMKDGVKCAYPGPRVVWTEAYGKHKGKDFPNAKWRTSPTYMLEKCAEAAALRKAFPEELGNELTAEEMEGRVVEESAGPIIEHEATPPRPTREQVAKDEKEARARALREAKEAEAAQRDMDRRYHETMGGARGGETIVPDEDDVVVDQSEADKPATKAETKEKDAPAKPADYSGLVREIMGKIVKASHINTINAIIEAYAEDLNAMQVEAPDEYQKIKDGLDGKREAFKNPGR